MWKLGNVEMWKLSKATFMTTSTIIMNKLGTNQQKSKMSAVGEICGNPFLMLLDLYQLAKLDGHFLTTHGQ